MKFIKISILSFLLFSVQLLFAQDFVQQWKNHVNKGKTLYMREHYMSAQEEFKKATQYLPTDTLAYVMIINCSQFTKQAEEAYQAMNNLSKLRFNSPLSFENGLPILIENQFSPEKVFPLLSDALKLFPNNRHIRFLKAKAYLQYAQFNSFRQSINNYIAEYPSYNAFFYKASALLNSLQDTSTALQCLKTAEQLFPDSLALFKLEYTIYLKKNDLQKAQYLIESLLKTHTEDPELYYNLALLYFQKEDYEQSAEICKKAIALDPNYVDAIYNVGTFYYYQGLQYNSALSDMTVAQYKSQGKEFEEHALAYFKQAEPYLKKAVLLNPTDLDAYENLNTVTSLIKNIESNTAKNYDWASEFETNFAIQITNLQIDYPDSSKQISNGEKAKLSFLLSNKALHPLKNIVINFNQPIITPGLNFPKSIYIDSLAVHDTIPILVDLSYNFKAGDVVGIENAEGAKDKLRLYARGENNIRSDLKEINLQVKRISQEIAEEVPVNPIDTTSMVASEVSQDIDFNTAAISNNFLIVIGIDNYQYWPPLHNAVHDASGFEHELINEYGFNPDFTYELFDRDATHAGLRNALIKVKHNITENDNLIIYYAGHGYYDKEFDDGSWIPANAHLGNELEYIPSSLLIKYLSGISAKHIVIIADACFSGSLFIQDKSYKFDAGNDALASRWGFSSGNLEYVADGSAGTGSPFANYLINYLKQSKEKKLPISELIKYVSAKVHVQTGQNPIGRPLAIPGNQGGEFIFTKQLIQ